MVIKFCNFVLGLEFVLASGYFGIQKQGMMHNMHLRQANSQFKGTLKVKVSNAHLGFKSILCHKNSLYE